MEPKEGSRYWYQPITHFTARWVPFTSHRRRRGISRWKRVSHPTATPRGQANAVTPELETVVGGASTCEHRKLRQLRTRRLVSAWLTLVPSKALTLLVQIIAIPVVYRAIGPVQFAAYAAVTAAVSILGFLNLGMGGALVTPLAQAAAVRDHPREARLLGATLVPIAAVGAIALC